MSLKPASAWIDKKPGAFDLPPAALAELIGPLSAADDALARLDERLRKSPVRAGVIARIDVEEACAALWAEGELVHLEDLVLRDCGMDARSPSHELVRAHAYLRLRRKAAAGDPKALSSSAGLLALAGRPATDRSADGIDERAGAPGGEADPGDRDDDEFAAEKGAESAAAEAAKTLLLRLGAGAGPKDPFIYDENWNEAARLDEWCAGLAQADAWPPLLGALFLAAAWQDLEPLQRQAWLAPILAGLYLRRRGRTQAHLLCFNLGLRRLRPAPRRAGTSVEQIRHGLAIVEAAARESLAQHDRLTLARELLARKCKGRRETSALPALCVLLLETPLVSVPMIVQRLKISPQAAQILVADLGPSLREITGRKRYRAWTVG